MYQINGVKLRDLTPEEIADREAKIQELQESDSVIDSSVTEEPPNKAIVEHYSTVSESYEELVGYIIKNALCEIESLPPLDEVEYEIQTEGNCQIDLVTRLGEFEFDVTRFIDPSVHPGARRPGED